MDQSRLYKNRSSVAVPYSLKVEKKIPSAVNKWLEKETESKREKETESKRERERERHFRICPGQASSNSAMRVSNHET